MPNHPRRLKALWILPFIVIGVYGTSAAILGERVETIDPLQELRSIAQSAPAPVNGVAVGKPAPGFEGRALDGSVVRLSDLKGKVVLLDFMASWCGVCVASFPELEALSRDFDQSKFNVVSVSLDGGETTDSTLKDLNRFLEGRRVSWPILFDDTGWDNAIAQSYGVVSRLPKHILIDRNGVVRWIGDSSDPQAWSEVRTVIERFL